MTPTQYVAKSDFWEFIVERELIRMRRLLDLPREAWTDDWILRSFSFTNVKRIHDRTTQLLMREFYDAHRQEHPSPTALLNAAVFRYHGTIRAARGIGWCDTWNAAEMARVISASEGMQLRGEKPFTSAYMIPNAGVSTPKSIVVGHVVDEIWEKATWILDTESWETMVQRMKTCFCVGSFMAKEILLDYVLITTPWLPQDWQTWTPVGPGARRGAGQILHGRVCSVSETQALEVCRDLYARRVDQWPESLIVASEEIATPELDLTDVQFQLCEWAKYRKVAEGSGRPKRLFRPTSDDITVAWKTMV